MSRVTRFPPAIMVYDWTAGEYKPHYRGVCTARWAGSSADHDTGDICGRPATEEAGDIDLCRHHFERLRNWRFWEKPLADSEERILALRDADSRYEQAVLESDIHRERVDAKRSCVYYIRRTSDGMIKIGTTAAFARRMATHRKEHGEFQVLLTHSGGRADERKMHQMFAAYRTGQSEWFCPAKVLLTWILTTRGVLSVKATQRNGIMHRSDLAALVVAAPADSELRWKNGRIAWPLPGADPAA